MTIQKNAVKEQVNPVIAQANYNRNINGQLKPDDQEKLESMVRDIDHKISELDEAKQHISACLDAGKTIYS